jgi:DNA polymerase-3 subunit delta'
VDALQKLCHDAMARAAGGPAVYFPTAGVPARAAMPALLAWAANLRRVARHDEHPWSEALLIEALVGAASQALAAPVTAAAALAGPRSSARSAPRGGGQGLDTLGA